MSKASEYREMSADQLKFALKETQDELFRLRFQSSTERLDAPSTLRRLRQDIARIKTVQTEQKLAETAEQAS